MRPKQSIATTFFLLIVYHSLAQERWCIVAHEFSTDVSSNASVNRLQSQITIPVVFHIVGNFSEYQEINEASLNTLLSQVNKDFASRNDDLEKVDGQFTKFIGASGITFGFPVNETQLAYFVPSSHAPFGNDDILSTEKGGHDPYMPGDYLNIWIADLAEGVLGWASKPGDDESQRAIVLDYKVLLDEEDGITHRTLTHELGHFLGLNHLEGIGGCDNDDGISDTPLQESKITGCPGLSTSCGSADMVQNFMNLNSDSCLLFFTKGQVAYMETIFSEYYPELDGEIILPVITSISDEIYSIQVGPNPFRNTIDINTSEGGTITVTDLNGKRYEECTLNKKSNMINTSQWPSGVYFFNIRSAKHAGFFKLIKTNGR